MQLTDNQIAALPPLLAQIAGMKQVLGVLQDLATDPTAFISGSVGVGTASAGNSNLQLPAMTPQESAQFFSSALTVFEARLMALEAQLTAL